MDSGAGLLGGCCAITQVYAEWASSSVVILQFLSFDQGAYIFHCARELANYVVIPHSCLASTNSPQCHKKEEST